MTKEWNVLASPKFPCPMCGETLAPRLPLYLRCYNEDCESGWFPLEEIDKKEYEKLVNYFKGHEPQGVATDS